MVLTTCITAATRVLAVLADAAPTHLGGSALLARLPKPRRLQSGGINK